MQAAGLLVSTTNLNELTKRAFVHLDGVTDSHHLNCRPIHELGLYVRQKLSDLAYAIAGCPRASEPEDIQNA